MLNYELQYIVTEDSVYLRKLLETNEKRLKGLGTCSQDIDSVRNLTAYANLVETHIIKGELEKADSVLQLTKSWTDWNRHSIMRMPDHTVARRFYQTLKGLEMYSRLLRLLRFSVLLDSVRLHDIKTEIEANDLLKTGYTKDLLQVALMLAEASTLASKSQTDLASKEKAADIYDDLLLRISNEYGEWMSLKRYSYPRLLLKQLRDRVIAARPRISQ